MTLLNQRRPPDNFYALFGEQVAFECLRRLSAFCAFEAELTAVIRSFGPPSI